VSGLPEGATGAAGQREPVFGVSGPVTDWTDGPVRVLLGEALERLRELPDESVHCVVTSPPYWGLRDYGIAGQLGLEPTPEEYVCRLVEVFREVRRVLRRDGTLWLNLGDSYAHGGNGSRDSERWPKQSRNGNGHRIEHAKRAGELKPKDLAMMPAEVAIALRRDGWWLRSDIIWSKPTAMPESVDDRPTTAHEHVFLLARSERYFYDADAVREPGVWPGQRRTQAEPIISAMPGTPPHRGLRKVGRLEGAHGTRGADGNGMRMPEKWDNPAGRNLRSVWTIATQPYPEAHFATFPEELARRCIAAGTSERGCCPRCGAPWVRVTERLPMVVREGPGRADLRAAAAGASGSRTAFTGTMLAPASSTTTGWSPSCDCAADEPVPCTVLDPFAGSGTTLAMARRMGRRAIGIELQAEYLPLIQRRVRDGALPLLEAR
jgi:DNA modification methylase